MKDPLTIRQAVDLATICEAAIHSWHVARLVDNNIIEGTARSIGDDRGYFAGPEDDIRDCYLRVTTRSGFEAFWPVAELVPEVGSYFIAPYDE
jgi:hypothetical protein